MGSDLVSDPINYLHTDGGRFKSLVFSYNIYYFLVNTNTKKKYKITSVSEIVGPTTEILLLRFWEIHIDMLSSCGIDV